MAGTVIDFLMKNKNADGTFNTLHPFTKTANVKTSADIEVMLTANVGSFKNGDVIPADTSADAIFRKLLQVQIPPVYTAPTISASVSSGSKAGSYEEGTSVNPTISSSFTKNDAGALTNIVIKKNGTEVKTSTTSPATHAETFVVSGTTTFNATATYAEGAVKQDNFGEDYSTGHIVAGSITSGNITYTGYRKYFWGADSKTAAATTSADVRGFANSSTKAAANGTTFTVSVTAGQTRATFAYPATLRDVSSVKYVEMGNDESKVFFNKTTVDVEGANGHTAISYKVYTYIPDQPFPSNMTLNVTI